MTEATDGHDDDQQEQGPAAEPARATRTIERGPLRGLTRRQLLSALGIATGAAVLSGGAVVALWDPGEPQATGRLSRARPAPTTEMERFDGTTISLAQLRGQPVVVNFFSSTCAPCTREMPDLQRVHRELGDRVTFLGIAVRDEPEAARALVADTGVTYDTAQDPAGTVFRDFGGSLLPLTALVDREGVIVERHTGRLERGELRALISGALLGGG